MRLALALLLLLPLAACDGGGGDPVEGTWTLTSLTTSLRVTSRTAQTLPDRSATPTGAVTVSGAVTASLGVVEDLFQAPGGFAVLRIASAERTGTHQITTLSLSRTDAEAQAQLDDEPSGQQFFSTYEPSAIWTRDGGRFTIVPRTLASGGAPTVTVRGAIAYPAISVPAGRPTAVETFEETVDGVLTITFGDDGTFEARSRDGGSTEVTTGTWERVADDRLRVTAREDGETDVTTFTARVEGGALVLEADEPLSSDPSFLRDLEPQIFADAGSLSAASFGATLRLRAGGQAAARTAERPALRPRPAVLDRLF